MVYTRPDISYAVWILSTAVENYSNAHRNAAKRVLKYLNTTKDYGIKYIKGTGTTQEGLELEVYVDASGQIHSVIGYDIKLAGGAVSYNTKRKGLATTKDWELVRLFILSSVLRFAAFFSWFCVFNHVSDSVRKSTGLFAISFSLKISNIFLYPSRILFPRLCPLGRRYP